MNIFIWIVLGLFGEWLAKRLLPEREGEAAPSREADGDTDAEMQGNRRPRTPPPGWSRGTAASFTGVGYVS